MMRAAATKAAQSRRTRATPKVRLGWATRERAELEVKRIAGPAAIRLRQLHDASWALVWPDGLVKGRFGTITIHEQRWM